ncbi:MAG TPA: hypothetical protein VFQ67_00115 [Allosphingosinicella sp.]|jgi:hypothetical protein|nr:hypothetical protein [Allosphingosinicella sp.]
MYGPVRFLVHFEEDLLPEASSSVRSPGNCRKTNLKAPDGKGLPEPATRRAPDLRHNMFICGSSAVAQFRLLRETG